eukprot:TRINITY_DN483_c1_g1_i1.p1 TRINITY_DN483_c1_g1~~TRINITY_DN483_c1_g1_i1.p1  ORF type:complete len:178 (-),score=94.02 TRINITY_DN483_c1_g1_i1:24-557(-)
MQALRTFSFIKQSTNLCKNTNQFNRLNRFYCAPAKSASELPQVPEHVEELAERIVRLNGLETALLREYLIKRLGIPRLSFGIAVGTPGAPGASTAAPTQTQAPSEPESEPEPEVASKPVEKTIFGLKLISFNAANKLKVLKEIRAIKPGMDLAQVTFFSFFFFFFFLIILLINTFKI